MLPDEAGGRAGTERRPWASSAVTAGLGERAHIQTVSAPAARYLMTAGSASAAPARRRGNAPAPRDRDRAGTALRAREPARREPPSARAPAARARAPPPPQPRRRRANSSACSSSCMPSPIPPTSEATNGTRASAPSIVTSGNGSCQSEGTISAWACASSPAACSGVSCPRQLTSAAMPSRSASRRISAPCGDPQGRPRRAGPGCRTRSGASRPPRLPPPPPCTG